MRTERSSRAESAAAFIGLIVLSVLMVDVFDTSNFVNPTAPKNDNTAPSPPPLAPRPNGTLVILLTSNLNRTDRFAAPTNSSSGVGGVPIVATLDEQTVPPVRYLWLTNAQGLSGCVQCLPVGPYVVTIQYDGLDMAVPASVFDGNQTTVRVNVTARAYRLTYSEEPGVLVTPSSAEYTMFAQVNSSRPVASVNQPVYLTVLEGASGVGYSVNATVISLGAPSMGTQWLQLGVPSAVNLLDATSISMTAWTSSTNTTVGPLTFVEGMLH